MKIEQYVRASSPEEVVRLLLENSDNRIIAGGAWMKLMDPAIHTAIDLSALGLDYIRESEEYVEIGAMTSLRSLEKSVSIQCVASGIVSSAAKRIMGISVKNIATIGGTIMGKYSFSDLLTPLLALEAKLVFQQAKEVPLSDFLKQKTTPKDLLLKVVIRKQSGIGSFKKVSRTALDFSVVNLAIVKNNNRFRIVVGARPGIAEYASKAEEYLSGKKKVSDEEIVHAAELAASELTFSTNQRGSAEYRQHLTKVYVERGLKAVIAHES